MLKKIGFLVLVSFFLVIASCSGDEAVQRETDNFDRGAILENWADNMIIPAYENYVQELEELETQTNIFTENSTIENLALLRSSWLEAYIAWQSVAMFEIGKAEEITLLNYTNIYPTNVDDLKNTIASGTYNLRSVNKQDEQGFPAIDYLINGLADSDEDIVTMYLEETTHSNYRDYLNLIVKNLNEMGKEVLLDWENGYRDTFVNNIGSSATSSVNKLINDYIFYFEKHLRAGKIGIPAGVFSNSPLSDRVEALYSKGSSKALFLASLKSAQDFFIGKHFGSEESGESLQSYLNFLNTIKQGEDLSASINAQFDLAIQTASTLDDDFEMQVENDNTKLLNVYDQLQTIVIYMKVDMLQALNVRVDYVDADGD
jgi:predicted lipoprotein